MKDVYVHCVVFLCNHENTDHERWDGGNCHGGGGYPILHFHSMVNNSEGIGECQCSFTTDSIHQGFPYV